MSIVTLCLFSSVLFLFHLKNAISTESTAKINEIPTDTADEDNSWLAYEPAYFDKNELCTVLICQKEELCLVKGNNAMCTALNELNSISGKVRLFKSNEAPSLEAKSATRPAIIVDHKNANDDGEWDQNKLREKISKHLTKLASKHQQIETNEERNEIHQTPITRHESLEVHRRHDPKMGTYQNCTKDELNSIKGRLYKWFADIHAIQKSEPSYELPKHELSCQEDVGFMFFTLDNDRDGNLSIDELFSIDNDPHEKCVKSFLDRCDTNSDDNLSINEWCDCFHWADDERHEPACHAALRNHDPHDSKSFFPNCDVDGYFKLDQCHNGQCWCVDKWGREFDHSRAKGNVNCQRFVI